MASLAIKKQRSMDRQMVREVVAERRVASIKAREAERAELAELHKQKQTKAQQAVASKYSKRDVALMKQIFDSYDTDGSGCIEKAELLNALRKQKEAVVHYDGQKKTLEQRMAQRGSWVGRQMGRDSSDKGVFLVDFSDAMFKAMDADKNGRVEFGELLSLLYPYANDAELEAMRGWVSNEKPPQKLEEFELNDEQRREIRAMFRLYDKDRNGTISAREFREAMKRSGLGASETNAIFMEADLDGSASLDLEEFTELMRQTFFGGEVLTYAMLYAPI